MGMAIIQVKTTVASARTTVSSRRGPIISLTGALDWNEMPKSKSKRIRVIHLKYCTGSGRSIP